MRKINSSISKKWMKYEHYLLTGEWHVHTNYTDGNNSVDAYCEKAIESGIPLIVFSEHVRRELDYDFCALLREIELARKKYTGLVILSGCEAKVLENGELDVSNEILNLCEIVLMAFHSFPVDKHQYYNALKTALTNPKVDIWAHPGLFLVRNNLTLEINYLDEVFEIAQENNVLIELNAKYNVPPKEWLDMLKDKVKFVRGSDVHSVTDFERRLWNIT